MTPSDMSQVYWEHNSPFGFDWLRGYYFLPALKRWCKTAHGIVIDIGCGAKPYQSLFGCPIKHYWGLDLPSQETKADICADAVHLPLPDSVVDVCFDAWLLDDLAEPNEYVAEVARVLKVGGLLIMLENQTYPEHDAPHDFYRYTRYGLTYLAHRNGLVVEEMLPMGGFWAQVGLQITAFALRAASGRLGPMIRVFSITFNIAFYMLDRLCYSPRGTSGYLAVFRKSGRNNHA